MRASLYLLVLLMSACAKMTSPTDCNLTTNLCSCDRRTVTDNPDCRDYEATSPTVAKEDCAKGTGTFSQTASCPTATRLGTCKFTAGSQLTYQRYYTASVATAAAGAAVCAYYKANCFVLSGNALCDAVWSTDSP